MDSKLEWGDLAVASFATALSSVEARSTPGDGITFQSESLGKIGLAICRDMDYPDPANRYGQLGVGLLLVPAWDQVEDRWWHGHMALMRGVENGYSIVRSAKAGFLTVSDDRGRVLAEATNLPTQTFTMLLATVPVRHDATLYQSWGDWFAWLCIATTVGLLVQMTKKWRARPDSKEVQVLGALPGRNPTQPSRPGSPSR